MAVEETRRRNEVSMARKRANAKAVNPAAANSGIGDGPLSPSSTGAMDSLLEKLRAAAPQARDQRDRRRRARLKDKHQVRVASGQSIPDLGDPNKISEGDDETEDTLLDPSSVNKVTDKSGDRMEPISEGEDIADRAASMLQGLRGDDGDASKTRPASRDGGSLRVRRRRESVADDERRNRRRRRVKETSAGESKQKEESISRPGTSDGVQSPTTDAIPEEVDDEEGDDGEDTILADETIGLHGDEEGVEHLVLNRSLSPRRPPRTVISPPSPEPGSSTERPGSP